MIFIVPEPEDQNEALPVYAILIYMYCNYLIGLHGIKFSVAFVVRLLPGLALEAPAPLLEGCPAQHQPPGSGQLSGSSLR